MFVKSRVVTGYCYNLDILPKPFQYSSTCVKYTVIHMQLITILFRTTSMSVNQQCDYISTSFFFFGLRPILVQGIWICHQKHKSVVIVPVYKPFWLKIVKIGIQWRLIWKQFRALINKSCVLVWLWFLQVSLENSVHLFTLNLFMKESVQLYLFVLDFSSMFTLFHHLTGQITQR